MAEDVDYADDFERRLRAMQEAADIPTYTADDLEYLAKMMRTGRYGENRASVNKIGMLLPVIQLLRQRETGTKS